MQAIDDLQNGDIIIFEKINTTSDLPTCRDYFNDGIKIKFIELINKSVLNEENTFNLIISKKSLNEQLLNAVANEIKASMNEVQLYKRT